MNHVITDALEGRLSLYSPEYEHDSCGVGFVASIHGKRSNQVLRMGIESLCHLAHRGAVDADAKTGDGAGVMTQIPYKMLKAEVRKMGHELFQESDLGVGFMFLPHDNAYAQARAKAITEEVIGKRGLFLFGWRDVPINFRVLGEKAQSTMPRIEQVLMGRPWGMTEVEYERRLFLSRNEIEKRAAEAGIKHFYIASFSHHTIAYKGLMTSGSLEKFYKDLANPEYETALCVYHQRYSTNTFPTWPLGQPFRMLAHNGEINTRRGNVNWMRAREAELQGDIWGSDVEMLKPIIQSGGSDSAELDNAVEAIVMSGRSILHAMTMLVPPAWRSMRNMTPELRAFYDYHCCFKEPWDGPAALVFTDGVTVGACLDRNGLRPSRFKITDDGIFSLGSEVGTIELDDANVIEKGRLGPGEMIAIDTVQGKLLRDAEIKAALSMRRPYGKWLAENQLKLSQHLTGPLEQPKNELDILTLTQRQIAFGYSAEELDMIVKPMVGSAYEAVGSMGDDTPLAVLSLQPRLLYTYFKQLFAQVTNPPVDPIREKLVMSLNVSLGWRRNLLVESPEHARVIQADSPILFPNEFESIKTLPGADYAAATVSCVWPAAEGEAGLERAIQRICEEAGNAVITGARVLILSDRAADHRNVPVPMLLAIGAVHHHLIRIGRRMRAGIVCETGEARDVHQMACLIGYGAAAIYPYAAFDTCREVLDKAQAATIAKLESARKLNDPKKLADAEKDAGHWTSITYPQALKNYRKALEEGLLKIMSKMGITVLASYQGAQIFEAIGVGAQVIERCFDGTPSQVGGIGFAEIARESLFRHTQAYAQPLPSDNDGESAGQPAPLGLGDPGYYRFRRDGEAHAVTPPVLKSFHAFVKSGKQEDYSAYVSELLVNRPLSLRDLTEFVPLASGPVSIDEVESIEDIRRRFTTAGMSLGALSPEAHECLAIAMNRIGGKSNSGEGGEDPERFKHRENGDLANSAIKQVASGRFGVNASYLASAKEIEIKMAQGSKPGEGGQLPGHKVSALIARLRHTVPGVMLISPPPHHDIYSIEDLAQLIYDLKQVNPRARICVKLVSEAGVGTVAAGVAKAHADIILISGHDGGTGASPLSSVKNAGSAWELGIAEAQQVLLLNGLRNRVTLRTDGGLRTGSDIVQAAILGAEEYNFGTIALIAAGCVYVRQCHLNTCPVGIATQDERLRAKFKGSPENIINFFNGVSEDVRQIMARLGVRTLNELIGQTKFLRQRHIADHPKANTLDLRRMLADVAPGDESPRHCTRFRNDGAWDRPLDDTVLQDAKDAVTDKTPMSFSYRVRNTNRAIGSRVSGEIGYQRGPQGLPDGTLELKLEGTAGQSLGAFLSPGLRLVLEGEANDYVGKSMSGGEIIVRPPAARKFTAHDNSIIGNTVMYGATGGILFASGRAGERFAVRNSGGTAVVEGVGDHGCEYMTNGTIVVLGRTGRNFGAGMTGGMAYVLDLEDQFESLYNPALVVLERLSEPDVTAVQQLIYRHLEATDSERAREILADWPKFGARFWKVRPHTAAPAPKPAEPHAKPAAEEPAVAAKP
ncbi:MAG TPA: glutamate synthase-related protein [Chthoniobacteraceae bacterium]|jgi:glutamate synthase (NADPH/NADH) large chain/glutamate synthase (ferredoxin)|nr:glutamate synthase-related protein [Chthoniobacteraceae bacterium]